MKKFEVIFEAPVQFWGHAENDNVTKEEAGVLFQFLALFTNNDSTEARLRVGAETYLKGMSAFTYGFGGHHMWVRQVVNGFTCDDRLFIIHF